MNLLLFRRAAVVMPFFFLLGCAPIHFTSGRPFTAEQIRSIEQGKTTKAEVLKLLGDPQLAGKDDEGLDIWTYMYIDAAAPIKGGEAEAKFRRLTVTFEGEMVKSFSYELSKE